METFTANFKAVICINDNIIIHDSESMIKLWLKCKSCVNTATQIVTLFIRYKRVGKKESAFHLKNTVKHKIKSKSRSQQFKRCTETGKCMSMWRHIKDWLIDVLLLTVSVCDRTRVYSVYPYIETVQTSDLFSHWCQCVFPWPAVLIQHILRFQFEGKDFNFIKEVMKY